MLDCYADFSLGATVNLIGSGRAWIVTSVEVKRSQRGKGHATKMMRKVLEDADAETSTLLLAIEPDGSQGSLSAEQLIEFYTMLGFRPYPGPQANLYVRYPERPRNCPECGDPNVGTHTGQYCQACGVDIFVVPPFPRS